jgi:protein tyrosine/serine phosphatase
MKKIIFLISLVVFQFAVAELPGNFQNFGPGLFRGARPSESALEFLKFLGVKTVVDLQGGDKLDSSLGWIAPYVEPGEKESWITYERNLANSLGMNFLNVPLNSLDQITVNEGTQIGKLLRFMSDPKNQPVYVHCEHGKDRTGLVVALYRVYYQNWSRRSAYNEMIQMGHGALNMVFTHDMDLFFWAATEGKK